MPSSPRAALLRDPNFAWLMSGRVVSALGDQFTAIALPWLVLKLTGDPLVLGMLVAMMAIPRAILILFGGALVDRYSPKRVLMLTKYLNALLLALLAWLVFAGRATLPMVTLMALGLSLASAFSIPAGTSMLPHAVPPQHLQAANGTMMAIRQVTTLVGPLLAGLLFALAGDGGGAGAGLHDARGLGLAFGVDCLSYVFSAWTLSRVCPLAAAGAGPAQADAPAQPLLRAIGAALALVWRDGLLRTCFIYWGLCACVVGSILQVALPLLASERLHGATALALLMSANGVGSLAGLAPLAAAVAGWLASHVTLGVLFAGAGCTLMGCALLAWLLTPMRSLVEVELATSAGKDVSPVKAVG
jgi:MFS family permease